jgi:3-(3-hydroxy-phenyl)propionate hydroxylase
MTARVHKRYAYRRPAEIDQAAPRRVPVVVVGAGPVGLTVALDLARRGQRVVVLNREDTIGDGSKAICFSKRTLDICDRLGVGDRLIAKGVAWNVGKVFRGTGAAPIYQFDVAELPDQKRPAFINLQQYYYEEYLVEALERQPEVDLRWRHTVAGIVPRADGVAVTVETDDGRYVLDADYVIACDGGRSSVRAMMGLDFVGRSFEDCFLIADVRFDKARPPERWFWFEPPFPGASALMHKQPDGVWRLDFQLGRNVDKAAAVRPENVAPFVEGMLGRDVSYEFVWLSAYNFQCRRMERFVHGRVIFAGDAAHLVSPFGARGGNGGVADADNLAWKLDLVMRGLAPASLLESYNDEATAAADVNILNSTRSTDFISPKSATARALRDAVLELAARHAFARPLVNSGRLASAVSFAASPLNTPDRDAWDGGVAPGSPAVDAPIAFENQSWLLEMLGGSFVLLAFAATEAQRAAVTEMAAAIAGDVPLRAIVVGAGGIGDVRGLAAKRYGAADGAVYLIRPDQYVAARWRQPDCAAISAALRRAIGA